ncbi:hypothetical protein PENANT_c003G02266 [Penicillium antarcticum]|uniref:Uncharacterized protein n=1 Tax=Penicillium antarcticum TaxID=416450 RepID=A0A1V6QI02_9EURO|nr:uncharacterized protein N7508_005883 [Penicillium antarcticum]KAJ5306868.1 hypothetical protein N7508_005883 [Penicillium antarcticum]OQD88851.1 hypothetical protein PENANT_c003G02266 [Penicillium antarcticum]
MSVHVVSKLDNSKHASFDVQSIAGAPLPESSIRLRPLLISLTSNNLSYARMGELLRWWDAYPVSENYPAPYNDPSAWGIVPAWGYATVEETTIPELPKGTVLYGFWPTTSTPTDLHLKPGKPTGHWIEISGHRQKMMPLYNRYTVTATSNTINDLVTKTPPPSAQEELERMAWTTLFIGGVAGYVLSEYVFSSNPETQPSIHPLGSASKLPWSQSDGDISSAVTINLAASTKTARVFSYYLSRKPERSMPLGLLHVTSAVSRITEADQNLATRIPSKAVRYEDAGSGETGDWLAERKPKELVIIDFGARGDALGDLIELVKGRDDLKDLKVVILQVGSEQRVYSTEEMLAQRAAVVELGKIPFNTSGVQDTVIERMGPEEYFATKDARWEEWLSERHLSVPGMEIVWGTGISGDGIEKGWERLCRGQVGAEEGLVYRFQ